MALNVPPSAFLPVAVSDNPRAWKSDIGLMNSSKTSVVFTIDSLIGFLKTHQIEVDSNYNEFKNLPRFASFGKMEPMDTSAAASSASEGAKAEVGKAPASTILPGAVQEASSESPQGTKQAREPRETATSVQPPAPAPFAAATRPAHVFIPTRKVRQPPGGGTLTIGNLFGGDDEPVPNRRVVSNGSSVVPEDSPSAIQGFIPSRKVREPPGGVSQISAIFGN